MQEEYFNKKYVLNLSLQKRASAKNLDKLEPREAKKVEGAIDILYNNPGLASRRNLVKIARNGFVDDNDGILDPIDWVGDVAKILNVGIEDSSKESVPVVIQAHAST